MLASSRRPRWRILIDDEGNSPIDAAGVPTTQGVIFQLSIRFPCRPELLTTLRAITVAVALFWRINDNNTTESNSYNESTSPRSWNQQQQNGSAVQGRQPCVGIKAPPPVKAITGVTKVTAGIKITVNKPWLLKNTWIL
jgi:hypothetical protein